MFMADEGNIGKYFDWLLERRVSDMVMDAPLTARTADWVESSGDMERVVRPFDNLSLQRREVMEAQGRPKSLKRS